MEEIKNRECKSCKVILPLTSFDKSYNKNCKNPCYRWDCPPCLRNKRKEYLKKRHKQTYVKLEDLKNTNQELRKINRIIVRVVTVTHSNNKNTIKNLLFILI